MRRILLFLFILAVLGGACWYFIVRPKQPGGADSPLGGFAPFSSLGDRASTSSDASSPDTATVSGGDGADSSLPVGSPFKKITTVPVAGYTVFTRTKTITTPAADPKKKPAVSTVTEHVVRYVARSSGYVYEIVDGGTPVQITNIYIPNIYEAVFADGGKTAILRFLRSDGTTVATYRVPIPEPNPDGTRTQLQGAYFPDNISSLAVSPDGTSVLQLAANSSGSVVSITTSANGSRKELLQTPFQSWIPLWQGNTVYLQTKAAASASGYLYRVDTLNKRLVHILGGIPGLTASISPKGTYMLYSKSANDGFETRLFSTKTNTEKSLGLSILPEKCTWLKNEDLLCAGSSAVPPAAYPDAWYMGTTPLNDNLYHIYTASGIIDTIDNAGASYDAVNLSAQEETNDLYFIDKETALLWKVSY